MKTLGTKRLIELYDYIVRNPEIVENRFKDAGITDALEPKYKVYIVIIQLCIRIYT